mmetsp:Transcript_36784/g.96760  ORF Transcript_36784/g.96760 Transcript_36784/m.96760 type:complete len:289 (+) Transcript_36784:48-914(+)
MRTTCLLLAALALDGCSGYSLPHASRPQTNKRLRRAAVAMDGDDVKVTIKRPSSAPVADAAPAAAADAAEPKVTVTVRKAAEPAVALTPAAEENGAMTTSIKVNKPAAAPAPPPKPQRPVEEEMLLNATQSANSSGVLEALQAGANPNVRDPKGRTPLHFMAGVGLAPAVVLLVHYGAQLDAQDADGLTPLHMAAGYANARTLRVLVAAGADIELTGESQGTPFEVVKSLGEYEWSQVYASGKKMGKKKDEKLQKLKQCVDILLDPEQVRKDNTWDDLLEETLRVISI